MTDLNLEGEWGGRLTLLGDIGAVVALLAAGRAGEPVLLDADAVGRLRVLAIPSLADAGGGQIGSIVGGNLLDGNGQGMGLRGSDAGNYPLATLNFDGANWNRLRSASAANLAAQTGFGVPLAAPPGEWNVNSNPAAGAQASASFAAGGAGVRHIGRRVSFGFSSGAALGGATTVIFNLRDGASGAGTVKEAWTFDLPAAIIVPFAVSFEVDVVGTAATAMTLESDAAHAGLRVFANLSGFDAS